MKPQQRLMRTAINIGKRKTQNMKRKEILKWCEQAKKVIAASSRMEAR